MGFYGGSDGSARATVSRAGRRACGRTLRGGGAARSRRGREPFRATLCNTFRDVLHNTVAWKGEAREAIPSLSFLFVGYRPEVRQSYLTDECGRITPRRR